MAVAALQAPVSHTAARPDAPAGPRTGGPPPSAPLLPVPAMRMVALLALLVFGAFHWMAMVDPTAGWRAAAATALGGAAAGVLLLAGRLHDRRRRALAVVATAVAGVAVALLAAGMPLRELRPDDWGAAWDRIAGGLDGLAGARVPYNGIDEGLRLVIPLGGLLLALLAGMLATWPRRGGRLGFPRTALVLLVALYAVPAVVLVLSQEFLRGAVLLVLLLLFARGERLPRRSARGAAVLVLAAVAGGLVAGPLLDLDEPAFDYEDWAQDAAGGRTESFDWTHDYSALLWPRDGREMLRIGARQRTYWKVETLDGFDGREWDVAGGGFDRGPDLGGVRADRIARWTQTITVNVRSLRSTNLPVAGTPLGIDFPDRDAFSLHAGAYGVGRELRRGDAYTARVYTPQPTRAELQAAGTDYGEDLRGMTAFRVASRPRSGIPRVLTWAGASGFKAPLASYSNGQAIPDGEQVLEGSDLARTYRLSRRLLDGSSTPYDYVQAIQRYLGDPSFKYSEAPPIAARTLDGFLFDARSGFCQQYSGAMALLLRMGGVPARVVTGFAPGAYNRKADRFVVRDVDAHSWVEAWFPGIGWVTFDPTPAAAPPRAQAEREAPSSVAGDVRDLGTTVAPSVEAAEKATEGDEDELPWPLIAAGAGGLVALLGLGRVLWRRRHRQRPRSGVLELERALRGAGWDVPPAVTLGALERRLAAVPGAVEYVRALRAQRYSPVAQPPTNAQRRRLRAALVRGRSPLARWRTWRALPPRLRARRP